ncbi:unnamed protein product [Schistosoma mattheei]|uniref:C2H2-type domain-containing protein n=1 Tax=Schistosoma mattheei TaxID=31246 RepID=A0A3P8L1B8_9TREM|nr:unnamed protein product [Schistosoma mattheei]
MKCIHQPFQQNQSDYLNHNEDNHHLKNQIELNSYENDHHDHHRNTISPIELVYDQMKSLINGTLTHDSGIGNSEHIEQLNKETTTTTTTTTTTNTTEIIHSSSINSDDNIYHKDDDALDLTVNKLFTKNTLNQEHFLFDNGKHQQTIEDSQLYESYIKGVTMNQLMQFLPYSSSSECYNLTLKTTPTTTTTTTSPTIPLLPSTSSNAINTCDGKLTKAVNNSNFCPYTQISSLYGTSYQPFELTKNSSTSSSSSVDLFTAAAAAYAAAAAAAAAAASLVQPTISSNITTIPTTTTTTTMIHSPMLSTNDHDHHALMLTTMMKERSSTYSNTLEQMNHRLLTLPMNNNGTSMIPQNLLTLFTNSNYNWPPKSSTPVSNKNQSIMHMDEEYLMNEENPNEFNQFKSSPTIEYGHYEQKLNLHNDNSDNDNHDDDDGDDDDGDYDEDCLTIQRQQQISSTMITSTTITTTTATTTTTTRTSTTTTSSSRPSEDYLEQFMKIDQSQNILWRQLADRFQRTLGPNQCGVCNKVLSCRSALTMHYRVHTGK